MSTATNSTTLSNSAAAIGVRNRLARDLDELTRAAAGAGTLAADDAGHLFDLSCHLTETLTALTTADLPRLPGGATRPTPPRGSAMKRRALTHPAGLRRRPRGFGA
jgi:hypothetical protein